MVATESLAKELINRKFNKLALWERGVNTTLFHPSKNNSFLYTHQPIALYFGRISKEKNIPMFLDAKWDGVKVVVGDGPLLENLKKKYPEVVFVGEKIGDELAAYIASSNIVVFPSLTDTYGLTIIEAMSCGIPVVGFNITGPIDNIIHGETGVIAKEINKHSLSDAMKKALEIDKNKCRKFAENKTWQICTEQFLRNLVENEV
jgi:glycosyltransferase involved in cell wall biosynthesis